MGPPNTRISDADRAGLMILVLLPTQAKTGLEWATRPFKSNGPILVLHSRKRYSLNVKLRRVRTFFSLFLACLWITTASLAEHVLAEFPLCQPTHSPCCPQPANNTSESCPACHIPVTVAAKKTLEQERLKPRAQTRAALNHRAPPPVIASHRELTAGLRYQRTVFDLKDDFRT